MSTHGGNIRKLAEAAGMPPEDLVDFSANINPLGPPEWLGEVVMANLEEVEHYPDPECWRLVEAIVERFGTDAERVVVGNGSAEILAALPRVLGVAEAVIPVPSYVDYARAAKEAGLTVKILALEEARDFALDTDRVSAGLRGGEVVFIGRPNNPTGSLCAREELVSLVEAHPATWFVVDEAFVEFVTEKGGGPASSADAYQGDAGLLGIDLPNLVVLRSLTKMYAIPGLRLGFAVARARVAEALRRAMVPWSVNVFAQAVGVAALPDHGYVAATRAFVDLERGRLAARLAALPGLHVFPACANYLLVKMSAGPADATGPADAADLAEYLLRRGLAIRVCDDFEGLDRKYFRVAVRTSTENDRLLNEMEGFFE